MGSVAPGCYGVPEPTPSRPQGAPAAFIRLKLYSQVVLVNGLVDSGNLVDDLMSYALAKSLKLPLTPDRRQIGTAGAGATLTVKGRAPPTLWFMEGLAKPVIICPLVVDNLSHPLNLGQAFLQRMRAGLKFHPKGGCLEIFGRTVPLVEPDAPVLRPSQDPRFKRCLEQIKLKATPQEGRLPQVAAAHEPQTPLHLEEDCTLEFESWDKVTIPAGQI